MTGDTDRKMLALPGGECIEYDTRFSARAQRLRLTLSDEGRLILTLPQRTTSAETAEFLKTALPWIERHLQRLTRTRKTPVYPERYPDHFVFPSLECTLPIRYEWKNVCWIGAREMQDHLLVSGAVLNPEQIGDILRRYLIWKADRVFEPELRRLSGKYSFNWKKLTVRYQKGRWGSCSSRGHISLNAQLLFRTREEIRYVMIHELCHTREMNHSDRFWREVARYCPDCFRIRNQLRRGEPELL